jgi:hypothetical protein
MVAAGWRACMTPKWVPRSPCFTRNRIGRGPSRRWQGKWACRVRRSPNALSNWSASRRFNISPVGGCIWHSTCCKRAPSASARSPDVSAMTRTRRSIGRSGGWSVHRPRHGGRPGISRRKRMGSTRPALISSRCRERPPADDSVFPEVIGAHSIITPPPARAAGRWRCAGSAPPAFGRWRQRARPARRSGGPSCRNCR